MTISRRRLLAAATVGVLGTPVLGASVVAQSGTQPKLGDPKSSFDTWFGAPTQVDSYLHYPPLSAGRASYFVRLDANENAEVIVGNFRDLAGGGIAHSPDDVAGLGQSQFVPDGLPAGPLAQAGIALNEHRLFAVRAWEDRAGHVVVVDRLTPGEIMGLYLFKETIVVRDSPALHPITPTETHLGPHSSDAEWEQYPGGIARYQMGFGLRTPPIAGGWTRYSEISGLLIEFDVPQSIEENTALIGTMLPLGDLVWSAWVPASPITPWQIRLQMFQATASGDHYLSAQFVDGDEQTGTVSRFNLTPALYT